MPMMMNYAIGTHRGIKRKHNEDAVAYYYPNDPQQLQTHGTVFAVADGVATRARSEKVSKYTLERLLALYYESAPTAPSLIPQTLTTAIQQVNREVFDMPDEGATTLVVLIIIEQKFIIASVGDSPAFWLNGQSIKQITTDHVMKTETGKTKLTRAIGHKAVVEVDTISGELKTGDQFILLSDGITKYYDKNDILQQVIGQPPHNAVYSLIQNANNSGGIDNSSVILVEALSPTSATEAIHHSQSFDPVVHIPDDAPATSQYVEPAKPVVPDENDIVTLKQIQRLEQMEEALTQKIEAIQQTQQKPTRSSNPIMTILLLVLIVFISAGGYYLYTLGIIPSVNDQPSIENTAVPTVAVTATPIPNGAITINSEILFSDTVVTLSRIDSDVVAFVVRPSQIYLVEDIYTAEGNTWYRIQDTDREQSGWIEQDNLPNYQVIPPSGS